MNQKNNENFNFQTELNENFSKIFNLKEELRFSTSLVSKVLDSNVFIDAGNDSKLLIEHFHQATSLAFDRFDDLRNSVNQILTTSKNLNINISNTVLNNEKHELLNKINELYFINKILSENSIELESEFNSYIKSEKTIQNRLPLIQKIKKRLNTINKLINEMSALSNLVISASINFSTNLIGFSEQFQYESSKNFSKRFDEEKNIILEDFNNRLSQITLDFELKQREIKSEFTEIKVNFKKLKNELDESNRKNNELNVLIENYEESIYSLSELELIKVKNKIENSSSDLEKKSELHLEFLNSSLQTKFDDIKSEFEIQNSEMNIEFEKAKNAKDSFVQLVQDAGIYKLTENYNKKAVEEKTEYQNFRNFTSRALYAAITCTVIILALPIIEYWKADPPVDTNYFTILARLTISLMFFVLAFYFSKQAAKHYECYQENHRTFLQLAALEPFMADMTIDEQKEIRKSLIPSYFNQSADGKFSSKSDEVGLPESFTVAFEKLVESVKEIKISQNSNKPDTNE